MFRKESSPLHRLNNLQIYLHFSTNSREACVFLQEHPTHKDGFYSSTYVNAPVFPQTVTLQQVDLVPIDPNGAIQNNSNIYYENEPEDL